MGMSASQARFLCLTARKSNVEFEGQQINQQRTTLSNTSGAYYSELCNLSVPTPPSLDEFTKVSYSFNDGAFTNTISSMIAINGSQYSISYIQQWQDDYSIVSAATSVIAQAGVLSEEEVASLKLAYIDPEYGDFAEINTNENGQYFYIDPRTNQQVTLESLDGNNIVRYLLPEGENINNADGVKVYTQNDQGKWVEMGTDGFYKIGSTKLRKLSDLNSAQDLWKSDPYLKTLSKEQLDDLMEQEKYYRQLLNEKHGNVNSEVLDDYYVRYIKDSATGSYVPYFYKAGDVENSGNYLNGLSNKGINCYTIGSETKTKEVLNQHGVVEKDSTGRYIGIVLYDVDENGNNIEETKKEYSLITNTTTDEAAYKDAMNKYNYEQFKYDQKVQEINSKIEIIQQQDKSLELELKHLDTEQSAIDTELDAVKKVISKNVDSSFKTFSA